MILSVDLVAGTPGGWYPVIPLPPLVGLGILALSGQDWEPVLARYGRGERKLHTTTTNAD